MKRTLSLMFLILATLALSTGPCLADAGSDFQAAQDMLRAARYDEAIALFTSVLSTDDPDLAPPAQLGIAVAYQGKTMYSECIAALLLGIESYPEAGSVRREMRYRMGEVYGLMGDTAAAEDVYKAIAAEDPEDAPTANLRLAEVYLRQKKHAEAIQLLKKNIAAYPFAGNTLAESYFVLGRCYRESGDLQNAVNTYRSLIARFPEKTGPASLALGICYQEQRKYAEARAAFQSVVDSGDGAANEARLKIDEVLRASGKYTEDLAYLQKLYGDVPELRAHALTRQAEVYSECLGQGGSAVETLRRLMIEYPEDPLAVEAQRRIGRILLYNLRDYEVAEAELRDFMKKYPDDPTLMVVAYDLAFCDSLQKKYAEAAPLFMEATRLKEVGNYLATSLYRAADCYFRAGDFKNTKAISDRLIAEYPDESWTALAKQRFSHLTGEETSGGGQ